MMKYWLAVCLLFSCLCLKSQDGYDYSATDFKARYIPDSATATTASIAGYINSHFEDERQKLRAIYTWVATNIRYDKDSIFHINLASDPQAKISFALRRRKGVCENFAAIFNDIAIKCKLNSFVVTGYSRQAGSTVNGSHSWCAVKLDGQWWLCDPTWDVGFRDHTNYFLMSPDECIQTHMPFDPLWQLLPQSTISSTAVITDAVDNFLKLDSVQRLEATAQRIKKAGVRSELERTQLAYVNMKIGIVYEDRDKLAYDSAVACFNNALSIYNNYITFRNNRFAPAISDDALKIYLQPISALLTTASSNIKRIGQVVENLQFDTITLQNRLIALQEKVNVQQDFIQRYISSAVADRGKIFEQQ